MSEAGRAPDGAEGETSHPDCTARFRLRKRLYFGWWLLPIPLVLGSLAVESLGPLFHGAFAWGIVAAMLSGLLGPLVLWRCPACGGRLPSLGMRPVLFSGARFTHECGALLQGEVSTTIPESTSKEESR
jgi:hypothetical protein